MRAHRDRGAHDDAKRERRVALVVAFGVGVDDDDARGVLRARGWGATPAGGFGVSFGVLWRVRRVDVAAGRRCRA